MRKTIIILCFVLCFTLPFCLRESSAAQKSFVITVAAGAFDRRETVTSFTLPNDLPAASYALRDESGRIIPLQIDDSRQASFVLSELKAGAAKSYRFIVYDGPPDRDALERLWNDYANPPQVTISEQAKPRA